jgi:hypothetical protein
MTMADLPPVNERTLPAVLRRWRDETPDRVAVSDRSGSLTYAELWARSLARTAGLASVAGDSRARILLMLDNHIDMALREGPFRKLHGRWEFHALDESACKVTLRLEFEPLSRVLAPALALGLQGLADRMVDDFVREADRVDA